ncbi:MAG TPA: MFS transporter [Chloroflexi bacterium]|nr:MFS transporter [Chloroflexota bacterium]
MMFIKRRYWQFRAGLNEFPRTFWTLMVASFIDRLGGFLLFPFFTLYITRKFQVGMTTVGIIFGLFSITGILGSSVGGALTDRIGRKPMLIFGLLASALSSVWMGLVGEIELFFIGAIIVGLFSNAGGPAQQAMVADLLPESQRAQGFAIWRVVVNLSATIGPAIGGLLAARSYLLLFLTDAALSTLVAVMVLLLIPETRVRLRKGQQETMAQSFQGYGQVVRDSAFMFFWVASVLTALVYMQMNSTLSVYLRDTHSVTEQGFGYLLSLNAAMVVLMQFWITRRASRYPPFTIMAWGTLLYALGFAMYGMVAEYSLFLLAMVVITLGEMLAAPVGQAIVARLAPADMRGRYMAFFGFSWAIPGVIGTYLAGLIMDYGDPRWVWFAAGILGLIATGMYLVMQAREAAAQEAASPTA